MKKAKLISAYWLLAIGYALFAAPKEKKPIEPVSVKIAENNMGENQGTLQNQVFNADGSVTYDAMMKYGGGGIQFIIDGKSGINLSNYNTILIELDYKTDKSWANTDIFPKFKVVTYGSGATFYQGGIDRAYFSADDLSGSITREIDISAASGKVLKIAVCLNEWKWTDEGGSNDDLVTVTIKNITFIP